MTFELKDGQGNLFKNDKGDNAKRPDYRGELRIGGKTYRLSAWIKEGNKGKFMSLSAQTDDQVQAAPRPAQAPAKTADPDDDVPF